MFLTTDFNFDSGAGQRRSSHADRTRDESGWPSIPALGQKQTFGLALTMSTLPPKADIRCARPSSASEQSLPNGVSHCRPGFVCVAPALSLE